MRNRPKRRIASVVAALGCAFVAAAACSNTVQGTLNLVTGPDDGFAATPKPTSLIVQLISVPGGDATTIGETSLPAPAGLALPPEDPNATNIVRVTGFDEKGDAVVSGSSVPFQLGEITGATLNLFVQRTGQFSRLPSIDGGTATLPAPPSSTPLLASYSEFLLIADGTGKAATTQVYDTFAWGLAAGGPVLSIPPLSLAYVDSYTGPDAAADASTISALLTLGANGKGNWLDLTDSVSVDAEFSAEASAPPGGSFADVAGGQSIVSADDGSVYIVGATRRTGAATASILHVESNGVLDWATLKTPRLGAAAAYVPGAGLYVFGGNVVADGSAGPDGSTEDGAELIQKGFNVPSPLGIPFDSTTGAGAVALDTTHVLLAGGVTATGNASPVRLYTTGSLVDGGPPLMTSSLPVTFVTAQAFALSGVGDTNDFAAVVVGTEASGVTSAYKLTASRATLLPFRVPRSNAQAIILPNGSLGVVGGDATTIESFIP
jgi:hypothetical protein